MYQSGKIHACHPSEPATTACGLPSLYRSGNVSDRLDDIDCQRCRKRLVCLALRNKAEQGPRFAGERNRGPDGRHAVWSNGRLLDIQPSLALRQMSPNGFSWGYAGSGPAQLALAILLDYTRSVALAEQLFIRFKEEVIGRIRSNSWELTAAQLDKWMGLQLRHLESVR